MAIVPLDYQTYSRILDQADSLVRKTGKGLTRVDALHAFMKTYPHDPRYAAAARRYGRQTAPAPAVVTTVAPARPVRKAEASATPAYEEIRLQGDALFRTGQVGSTWEGMGMVASSQPGLFNAYLEEQRNVSAPRPVRETTVQASVAVQKQAPPSPPPSATDTLMQAIATRQAAEPGLSFVQASDAVRKDAPELYDQYLRDSRYPHLRGQPMPTQADPAPTYEAIVAMADARVAKAAGLSRRDALIALVQEHPHEEAYSTAYRTYHLTAGLQEHRAAQVAKRQARS